MSYSAEERAIVWLCMCTDFDYRTRLSLLRAAGDASRLLTEWEEIFRSVIKTQTSGVYNSDRACREREADGAIERLEHCGCFAVTISDSDYPQSLAHIYEPPLILYGSGNRSLLLQRKFCVVGSRRTPPWAENRCRTFSEALAEHFAIVTGLAEGGDSAAIAGALPTGKLICVLPNGLNECYPAAHASMKERIRREGLLLSEYLPDEPLKRYNFHARNRLLAGLSEGVLVVSAGKRSGALITANRAADYGRDVFAFPHNLGAEQGEGCNELIKTGASLVTEPNDILSIYGFATGKGESVALDENETKALAVLREAGELHVSQIAERIGLPLYETLAVLSALEMKNFAVKAGGNRYGAL